MRLHDSVKELASSAILHHNMHVPVIDECLVELYNVGVVDLSQNEEFFLEQLNIFGNVSPQDALHSVRHLGVRFWMHASHRTEVAATNDIHELVNCADVRGRKLL